jgi:hypothetical protein
MALDEQPDHVLDPIDVGLALGLCRSLRRPFERGRVSPSSEIAESLLRPPAGRGEVQRGIGAERQLPGLAAEAIAQHPTHRARRVKDQVEAGDFPVGDLPAALRKRKFSD